MSRQEQLKWVKEGQPVEVAFDLYPGEIFDGKVENIWQGSGTGQMLPSGDLPTFNPELPDTPQGLFAVQIVMNDAEQSQFPMPRSRPGRQVLSNYASRGPSTRRIMVESVAGDDFELRR